MRCWALALLLALLLPLVACTEADTGTRLSCAIVRTPEPADGNPLPALAEIPGGLSVTKADGEELSILYEITELPARALVSVSLNFTTSADSQVTAITVQDLADPNTAYLTPGINRVAGDSHVVKQVFRANADGTLHLRLSALCTGDVSIEDPTLRLVEADDDYFLFTDSSGISLVLSEQDFKDAAITREDVAAMVAYLAQCDGALRWLTGETNAEDKVYVCTEACAVTALAGDPIFVDRGDLALIFAPNDSDTLEKTSGPAVLCHELSHTYDREEYAFDREFFAAMKQYYALLDSGFAVTPSFFSDKPRPSAGAYNYEAVLRTILERTPLAHDPAAWEAVRNTLSTMRGEPYRSYTSAEKFSVFTDRLSSTLGQPIFTDEERAFLLRYYATK